MSGEGSKPSVANGSLYPIFFDVIYGLEQDELASDGPLRGSFASHSEEKEPRKQRVGRAS
jgi:hypothetical protein